MNTALLLRNDWENNTCNRIADNHICCLLFLFLSARMTNIGFSHQGFVSILDMQRAQRIVELEKFIQIQVQAISFLLFSGENIKRNVLQVEG